MTNLRTAIPIALLMLTCSCSNGPLQPIRINGEAQGTYYSITYYDTQHRNLKKSIDSLLYDFDLTASLWVDSSLIRKVNENKDSVVNDCFATLVNLSTEMNRFTDGCFDCTVGALVNAWGFGFKQRKELSETAIDSMLQYVGLQPTIEKADDGTFIVHKANSKVSFDFNAIAQGYSTDMVSRFLEERGITDYIVDIGGEVYAKGAKPDGSKWKIGIERPAENKYSSPEVETIIELNNQAVVTSGNYRKYYEKDGIRYSHTIDPTTGHPVEHTLLSVSVIDTVAWRADALATAFMVMGLEKSKKFIEAHPYDSGTQAVFFIYNDNGEYSTYATEGFNKIKGEKTNHSK